ncbi:MAG: NADPH-dependent glutamate synthase [Clostridia bacterium]
MNPKRAPMPVQPPQVRNHNFDEVALGYLYDTAVSEAKRCLACKNKPCVSACPVAIDIPAFIERVAHEDMEGAYELLSRSTSLPAVCGRVCPQESQCEGKCVRGIKGESVGIGRLERFVADWHREHATDAAVRPTPNGHKVAVIGAGPSGLTCAGDLAKLGYAVTVYEALHIAGGVLSYGIPEFRLPKAIVNHEIDGLRALGVAIECNTVIGKTLTVDELFGMGYEALFIGSGAGLPNFMNIPGESLKGVYSANEYLTRINLMKAYREGSATPIRRSNRVAVVGGGNVAMDAARCAKRLGAQEVYIVYRRGMEELPARREEVEHAQEEGILFKTLCAPVRVLGDENGFVSGMVCVEMMLGEPDASGRRRPVVKAGSEFTLTVDTMIMSIGTSPNPLLHNTTPGLETNRHGCIVLREENGLTSRDGVYAGGDAVTGAATVILAMGAGKNAAAAIDAQIQQKVTHAGACDARKQTI